ncbi:MAG: alpha-amylase family glycosyl hydrolase [Polyangiaceae bacterium]|jgi:glycosidase
MPTSIFDPEVQNVIDQARAGLLFKSPDDWRDVPIYFVMVDRFNNDAAAPHNLPFDAQFAGFQGGNYAGVSSKLRYIKDMGFGAIWLSPVLKNPPGDAAAYHGYGIQNYLAAEPRFATNPANADAELRALVDAAHALGLYVIFDIVLHHAGDVFAYVVPDGTVQAQVDWKGAVQPIAWRNAAGVPDPAVATAPAAPAIDAAVWPTELRDNALFTRMGNLQCPAGEALGDYNAATGLPGDFYTLKGIEFYDSNGNLTPAAATLIRAYQYVIARFDVDAFRIDTLKYLSCELERTFGSSMREFAQSVGKKSFFTFGEVWDSEAVVEKFIGREVTDDGQPLGVDAALDYPLFSVLPSMAKGLGYTPNDVAQVFQQRRLVADAEDAVLTAYGEAGQYFVTFLDNHDQPQRFGYTGPIQFIDQIELGLVLLFAIPGIPCVYYGTEQGLQGHQTPEYTDASMVREALWGKAGAAFDATNPLYAFLRSLGTLRASQPALRYGRCYFRPTSIDGKAFGVSVKAPGVIALSRILSDQEVVVVANTDRANAFPGQVIVDGTINAASPTYSVLLSNLGPAAPCKVVQCAAGGVTVAEVDGSTGYGPLSVLPVSLQPGEVQILAITK